MSRQLQKPILRGNRSTNAIAASPCPLLWPPPGQPPAGAAYMSTRPYSAQACTSSVARPGSSPWAANTAQHKQQADLAFSRALSSRSISAAPKNAAALDTAKSILAAVDLPSGAAELEAFVFSSRDATEYSIRCVAAQQCLANQLLHESRACVGSGPKGLHTAARFIPVVKRAMQWSTTTQDTCSSSGIQSLARAAALVTAAAGAPEHLSALCTSAAQAITGTHRLRRTAAAVHILQANVAFDALQFVLSASAGPGVPLPVLHSALAALNTTPIKRTIQGVDAPPDAQLMALFEANLALPPLTDIVPLLVRAHAKLEEAFLKTWMPQGSAQWSEACAHSGVYLGWHAQACAAARAAGHQPPPPLHLMLRGWLPGQGGGAKPHHHQRHRDPMLQAVLGFAVEPLTAKHAARMVRHLLLQGVPLVRVLDAATALAPLGELPGELGTALLATAAVRGDAKSLARTLALYMHDDSIWEADSPPAPPGAPWVHPADDWVALALKRPVEGGSGGLSGTMVPLDLHQDGDMPEDSASSDDSGDELAQQARAPSTLVRAVRLLRHARHGMSQGDTSADTLIAQLCAVCIEAGHGDQLPEWARPSSPSRDVDLRNAAVSIVAPLAYLDSSNEKSREVLHSLQQALVAASQELEHSPVCDTSSASFHWEPVPPQQVLPPPSAHPDSPSWVDDGTWQSLPMGSSRSAGAAVQMLVAHLAASFDASMPPLEAVVRDPAALVAYDEALHSMTQQADRLTAAALSPLQLADTSPAALLHHEPTLPTAPTMDAGLGLAGQELDSVQAPESVESILASIAAECAGVDLSSTDPLHEERLPDQVGVVSVMEPGATTRVLQRRAKQVRRAAAQDLQGLGIVSAAAGEFSVERALGEGPPPSAHSETGGFTAEFEGPNIMPDFASLSMSPQTLRPRMSFSGHSKARLEVALGDGRRGVQKPTRVWLQAFLRGLGLQRQLALQHTAEVEGAALRAMSRVEPSASQAATVLRAVHDALHLPKLQQETLQEPMAEVEHKPTARIVLDVRSTPSAPVLSERPPSKSSETASPPPSLDTSSARKSSHVVGASAISKLAGGAAQKQPRVSPRAAVARVRRALHAAAAAGASEQASAEGSTDQLDEATKGILQRSAMHVRRPWHSFLTPQQLQMPAMELQRPADEASRQALETAQLVWNAESTSRSLRSLPLDHQGVRALVLAAQLACSPLPPAPDARAAPGRRRGRQQQQQQRITQRSK